MPCVPLERTNLERILAGPQYWSSRHLSQSLSGQLACEGFSQDAAPESAARRGVWPETAVLARPCTPRPAPVPSPLRYFPTTRETGSMATARFEGTDKY